MFLLTGPQVDRLAELGETSEKLDRMLKYSGFVVEATYLRPVCADMSVPDAVAARVISTP